MLTKMTAVDAATKIKDFIDFVYGDPEKPGLFDRLYGGIYTRDESKRNFWDLFTTDDNVALVMIVEGIYEWSDKAAANVETPGWLLEPITGYALGIYPTE